MIQLFHFLSIMEHTAGIIEAYISLMTSLLKVFVMFHMRLFYDKHNEEENVLDPIALKCSNCNRSTGLFLKDKTIQEMVT